MTDYSWWEEVAATEPLMQGDIVEGCPVAVFNEGANFDGADNLPALLALLQGAGGIQQVRSIVMTQACDLEQHKIRNVILCPAYPIEEHQTEWAERTTAAGKQPSAGAWNSYIKSVKLGRVWNLTLLRKREAGEGVKLVASTTAIDFHEVFSLPLSFLEQWVKKTGEPRLRLCPPYREHLSQAFARFFMRVGLPVDIGEL